MIRPAFRALRSRAVAVRDALDRRRHPGRQRKAVEGLRGSRPEALLFVCLGNICRSPYAAHAIGPLLEDHDVTVGSAGFIGPDRNPPREAVDAAAERGVEHAHNLSRVLTPDMVTDRTAIFIFDRFNAKRLRGVKLPPGARIYWLGDFDSEWAGRRAIPDPWGKPPEEFSRTFERIDRCVRTLAESLTLGSSAARS